MPYVPSKKTDGKSNDRILIDEGVKKVAEMVVFMTKGNARELSEVYMTVFKDVANTLYRLEQSMGIQEINVSVDLARIIFEVGEKYNYDGAWFGELNYAITRLIQVVPNMCVEKGYYKTALEYWLYAVTAGVLKKTSDNFSQFTGNNYILCGLVGVFIDILHEYKRRVNTAYECAQIIKSGDCYDTPYLTRIVEMVDEVGKVVGHQEIMLKKENDLGKDIFGEIQIKVTGKDK